MTQIETDRTLDKPDRADRALVGQYGPGQVWQMERLSENFFMAWLYNGLAVLVMILPDGSLRVKEVEVLGQCAV